MTKPDLAGKTRARQGSARRWRWIGGTLAGLFAVYLLAGYVGVPWLVDRLVKSRASEQFGLDVVTSEVAFDPFCWCLMMTGVVVQAPGATPLLTVDRLVLDLDARTLVTGTIHVASIDIDAPAATLPWAPRVGVDLSQITGDGGGDGDGGNKDTKGTPVAGTSVTGDPVASEPLPDRPASLPALRIGRVSLQGGSVRIVGPDAEGSVIPVLDAVRFDATGLDTRATTPGALSLAARLAGEGGGGFDVSGTVVPSTSDLVAAVRIAGLPLAALPRVLPAPIGAALPDADIDAVFQVTIRPGTGHAVADRPEIAIDALELVLQDLRLQPGGLDAPLLALDRVDMGGGRFSTADGRLRLDEVRLADGQVRAAIDAGGTLDWATWLAGMAGPDAGNSADDAAPLSGVTIARLGLENVQVTASDDTRVATLGATVLVRDLTAAAAIELEGAAPAGQLTDVGMTLAALEVVSGADQTRLVSVGQLALTDGLVDLGGRHIEAARVGIDDVEGALTLEADGVLREIRLVSVPQSDEALPLTAAASEWQAQIGELVLGGLRVDLRDAGTTPMTQVGLRDGTLTLRGLDTGHPVPVSIAADLDFAVGGRLHVEGSVSGDLGMGEFAIGLDGVALVPLAPQVARHVALRLESGKLSGQATVSLQADAGASPRIRGEGTLGLTDLLLREADGKDTLLGWRSMDATGISFALAAGDAAAPGLRVRELRLDAPVGKFVFNADGSTNIDAVLGLETAAPGRDDTAVSLDDARDERVQATIVDPAKTVDDSAPGDEVGEGAGSPQAVPIRIDRVRIDGGTLDFADLSLFIPFATRIEQLSGLARGISSASEGRTTVALTGRVGEFGEAGIDGQLALLDPASFADFEVSFRNVSLSALTPYSATFAGREIRSGDLDLDLEYRIDAGRLTGENQLVLENLRLGKRVASPDAMELPLDLAVALMTDRDGRIDLAIPVSGDVDDPQFSYGPLIRKAIRNALVSVVSAPFRFLAGGREDDAESLRNVRFVSGSSTLAPRAREQVARLAGLLADRPELAIAVVPGFEPSRDAYAVRRLAVRRAHATLMGYDLPPGEDPGPVSYTDPDSQMALEALLTAREGDAAVSERAVDWAKEHGGQAPSRVQPLLAALGRGAGDPDWYRQMYLHLVHSTPLPDDTLADLGAARAAAVTDEFLARGLAATRVKTTTARRYAQARPTGVLLPLELAPAERMAASVAALVDPLAVTADR